jgi:hypothetical protein
VADVFDTTAHGYNYTAPPATPTEPVIAARRESRPLSEMRVIASVQNTASVRVNSILRAPASLPGSSSPPTTPTTPTPPAAEPRDRSDDATRILRGEPPRGEPPAPVAPAPAPGGGRGTVVESGGRVFAVLNDLSATRANTTTVNVFLNCPYLSPQTPTTDPHYAGTFSLFGLNDHARHGGAINVQLELTDVVARLRQSNPTLSQLEVQLLPVSVPGGANLELKPGRIDISVL